MKKKFLRPKNLQDEMQRRTYYLFASGSFVPTVIVYSREGSQKFFDKMMLPNPHENKRSHTPPVVYEGKTPNQTTHVSKRLSQDESESSSRNHFWKRVNLHFNNVRGTSLPVIEIHDETDNPLRTILALAEEREGSYDSDESVSCLNLMEPPSTAKMGEGPTFVSYNKVKATLDFDICKLSKCDVDCASSLKDEVQVIIMEMNYKDVDISSLRKLLHDFFDLATLYNQARSMLYNMNEEAAREKLFFVEVECLSNAMLKEDEKIRATSSIRQSL
ncbi:hypothetical protein CQW23_09875 [Capsicum baccatum]|uniref:Uncharacterized protein n=1 Tax=Capsicum baccatum TaxID=33114 RepID=A0A2G2WY18_CAPBA|nr:hypothetical protein CQW23_09875 [Capsicum baccatum]